jgi:hypothetical protein
VTDDHLQAQLDRQSEARDWQGALGTMEEFIAREDDPLRKAAYLHAAAVVARDQLGDPARSVAYAERALTAYFTDPAKLTPEHVRRMMKTFALVADRDEGLDRERAFEAMAMRLANRAEPHFREAAAQLEAHRREPKPAAPAAPAAARGLWIAIAVVVIVAAVALAVMR